MNSFDPQSEVPPPPSRRNLIYTQRTPPSSGPKQESIGGEPDSTDDYDDEHESPQRKKRDAGLSQASLAKGHSGRVPDTDLCGDVPGIPRRITYVGDRTDYRHVIKRLGECRRSTALKSFRGRHSGSDWMRDQVGWLKNASLLASAEYFSFDPTRVLFCSRKGKLCFQPYFCYRCNVDQRVEPMQKMFANAFARRPRWHSLALDYEMRADQAGIWTGIGEDRRAIYLPHHGKADGRFLHCCPHELGPSGKYLDILFFVVACLKKAGIIDGWLAVVEPSLSFWPDTGSRLQLWSGIEHGFLPHLHVLVCGQHPFGNALLRAIYDALQQLLGDWSYANLWFNPVTSQEEIKKWINYCIKPFPLAKWYSNGLLAGCNQPDLNLLFDEVVLQSCPGIMSRTYSPRRGGVLATNSGDSCVIEPVPPLLTRKQFSQCKDDKFYHEHQDSFWRTIEKRELRQGRNFRCPTQNHQAAVRRISAWKKRQPKA
jgi:hypothetical protein